MLAGPKGQNPARRAESGPKGRQLEVGPVGPIDFYIDINIKIPLLFRAVANNKKQREVLDKAVRSTEDEETGCEFLKESRRWWQ